MITLAPSLPAQPTTTSAPSPAPRPQNRAGAGADGSGAAGDAAAAPDSSADKPAGTGSAAAAGAPGFAALLAAQHGKPPLAAPGSATGPGVINRRGSGGGNALANGVLGDTADAARGSVHTDAAEQDAAVTSDPGNPESTEALLAMLVSAGDARAVDAAQLPTTGLTQGDPALARALLPPAAVRAATIDKLLGLEPDGTAAVTTEAGEGTANLASIDSPGTASPRANLRAGTHASKLMDQAVADVAGDASGNVSGNAGTVQRLAERTAESTPSGAITVAGAGALTTTGQAPTQNLSGPALSQSLGTTAPPVMVAIATPVHSPYFAEETAQQVTWLTGHGIEHARINVTPGELGPIEIRIALHNDEAVISFAVTHPESAAAIEDALPRLREMLAANGISLGQTSVGAQTDGSGADTAASRQGRGFAQTPEALARAEADAAQALEPTRLRAAGNQLVDLFA